MKNCRMLKGLLKEEKEALRWEFGKRRKRIERELGREVEMKEAEKSFIADGFEEFAKEFRVNFCAICGDKDECRNG